jgi:nucleoside-diphosphate-sugar epimerase
MRPALIFGASRGVGLVLARLMQRRNVPVMAMLRPASESVYLDSIGVDIVRGNALSREDVGKAFAAAPPGCNVISTVGGRAEDGTYTDEAGNINIIDAAVAHGAGRFVLVTSIGCGDMAPYRSERAIAAFGAAVDAKTRAEDHLRRVMPAGTIVRPGGLRSDPGTGRGILSCDPQMHGFINRDDVADLIIRVLDDPATIGQTFSAVDADAAQSVNPVEPFPLRAAPSKVS